MSSRRSQPVVHARETAEVEFSRIVAFSDGVFAIAITLLVLALEVPADSDLVEALRDRGEEFFAYFLSFAVTACSFAIIRYASRRELMRVEETDYRVRRATAATLVVTAVFAVSIPIAFLSPLLATISWASLFVVGDRVTDRIAGPAN
jgi:uncharacterized membrane protein